MNSSNPSHYGHWTRSLHYVAYINYECKHTNKAIKKKSETNCPHCSHDKML